MKFLCENRFFKHFQSKLLEKFDTKSWPHFLASFDPRPKDPSTQWIPIFKKVFCSVTKNFDNILAEACVGFLKKIFFQTAKKWTFLKIFKKFTREI